MTNPEGSGGQGGAGAGGSGGVAGMGNSSSGASARGGAPPAGALEVDVQLASDFDPNAPGTVGIVTFSVRGAAVSSARVEFGPDTDYGSVAPVDLSEPDFRTLLLGNKPDSTVHFRVVVDTGDTTLDSGDLRFLTGPPPIPLLSSFEVIEPSLRQAGFLLTSYWRGQPDIPVFILDADGDPVWWYRSRLTGIARASLSHDGRSVWLVSGSNSGAPLERVSLDTLTVQLYEDAAGSHDITAVAGDLMAFLDYGDADCDAVTEIDVAGNQRRVFDLDAYLERTGALTCHANALRYHAESDSYVLSSLSEDVFVVARDGSAVTRLGDIVPLGNQAWGRTQHGVQLLDDAVLLFANDEGSEGGGFQSGGPSTVLEYSLVTGEESFRYETGSYSANLGDAQRLPGGNTLVVISNAGILREVTPSGEVVLQVRGTDGFGYGSWLPSLYGSE